MNEVNIQSAKGNSIARNKQTQSAERLNMNEVNTQSAKRHNLIKKATFAAEIKLYDI